MLEHAHVVAVQCSITHHHQQQESCGKADRHATTVDIFLSPNKTWQCRMLLLRPRENGAAGCFANRSQQQQVGCKPP